MLVGQCFMLTFLGENTILKRNIMGPLPPTQGGVTRDGGTKERVQEACRPAVLCRHGERGLACVPLAPGQQPPEPLARVVCAVLHAGHHRARPCPAARHPHAGPGALLWLLSLAREHRPSSRAPDHLCPSRQPDCALWSHVFVPFSPGTTRVSCFFVPSFMPSGHPMFCCQALCPLGRPV